MHHTIEINVQAGPTEEYTLAPAVATLTCRCGYDDSVPGGTEAEAKAAAEELATRHRLRLGRVDVRVSRALSR